MGAVSYEIEPVTMQSYYQCNASGGFIIRPTTDTKSKSVEVTDIPEGARVTRAVLAVHLDQNSSGRGSNYATRTVAEQTVKDEYTSIRLSIQGNRTVTIPFEYKCTAVSTSQGTHTYTVRYDELTLTIEWLEPGEENYTDNEVMIPAKGVWLFPADATEFTKGGIVLQPTKCTVREQAAGKYELNLTHPMDAEGRWQGLLEERIIRAPVPPHKIPETTLPVGKLWQVKSSVTTTPLYSRLPRYERAETPVLQWNQHTEYHAGDYRWDYYAAEGNRQTIFRSGATQFGTDTRPGTGLGVWAIVGPLQPDSTDPGGGTGIYYPGTVIRDLDSEETVTFIATFNYKYSQVRDYLGRVGYVLTADIEETQTSADPIILPERRIYTQLFRIKSVGGDEAEKTVTVRAEHISYDFQGNKLFDCSMIEAEPATAVALLQGRLMNEDTRTIACPFEYPLVTAEWSFQNPIQALLDPDDGLAAQLQGIVLRDNADIFILPQRSRIGARLAYGVNLLGVEWKRNTDSLVTRIIPRAGDGEGGHIYLDELFIDSAVIGDYAVVRTEVLDSKYSVGQEIEKPDGTTRTLSRSDVIERMRQEAEDRYYVDGCDKVTVTLDVNFVLLGDTEEYRQYRNLQRVNLYDQIDIDTGHMQTSAQVIGYEWDCLAGRYNGISIGKVFSMARKRIPGYRVASGAITYGKLSPGLIKWIRGES